METRSEYINYPSSMEKHHPYRMETKENRNIFPHYNGHIMKINNNDIFFRLNSKKVSFLG